MKITIIRRGGFSGITLPPKTLETSDPAIISYAEKVCSLKSQPAVADGLTYVITTVSDEGKTQETTLHGELDNEDFQELLKAVL